VPLLVAEPTTTALKAAVDADPDMVVWWGTQVECVATIARLERDGMPVRDIVAALERLDSLSRSWHEVQPTEQVRRASKRLLRVHSLRAADALQLSAALAAAEDHPASLEFTSLDARLVDAARREGFSVPDVATANGRDA
jgi:predicted nucleic acid-binding protein